jgi:AraC family ethanolamine operon transcriptional activator
MAIVGGDGLQACDLVSIAGLLRVCEMEMVLLGGHGPRAIFNSRATSATILCHGEVGFPFRGRFVLPAEWCLLGYIHQMPEDGWCHGTPLESGMAFLLTPEGISEFKLGAHARLTVVLAPVERLHGHLVALEPHQPAQLARRLSLFKLNQGAQAANLREHFLSIGDRLGQADGAVAATDIPDAEVDALIASYLIAGVAASPDDRPQCSRGRRTHYLVVQRTEQFMRANIRREIYINELCNAAGVSERSLRYAFDELLGVSPSRYLSLLRLCTACRSLTLSDASRRSVKSVALSCGLWDLSRFADHYRRVFGELPRQTLMRTPSLESSLSSS